MSYFFFVITLFVAILYYTFNPSDQIKTIEKPRSEMAITSFLAQHKGAVDYINERLAAPFLSVPSKESDSDPIRLLPCDIIEKYADLERENAEGELVGLLINECQDDYASACPNGECVDPETGSTGFVSTLICLDAVNQDEVVPCVDADPTHPRRKKRYVMTYGYDQEWWWDEFQGAALWREAILRKSHASGDCGVIIQKGIGTATQYLIDNTNMRENATRVIPQKIITELKKWNVEFYNSEENHWPISHYPRNTLVCLTPVNEPYVSNGLIFSIDSYLNVVDTRGHFYHSQTPTEEIMRYWPSLASHNGAITTLDKLIKSELVNMKSAIWTERDGVLFNGEDFARFPDNLPDLRLKSLGNSFTISYVVEYINGAEAQATFGSIDIKGDKNGVMVGYNEGADRKICFNINPNDNPHSTSALCADLEGRGRVQVTYIVDYDHHELYINNQKVASTNQLKKPLEFFTNYSDRFYVGKINGITGGLNGRLFNFRVYNRVLNEKEREYNYNQDSAQYNL